MATDSWVQLLTKGLKEREPGASELAGHFLIVSRQWAQLAHPGEIRYQDKGCRGAGSIYLLYL
jgi:hypothetical protein